MNIAMWSGPRNLSTALMYAFAARGDCAVMDEPFYAAYLARAGVEHPMRDAIIAAGDPDPERVAARCTAPPPEGHAYQKHMTHHILPGDDTGWMASCTNVFLIRHPARVIASYARKRDHTSEADLGYSAQVRLFDAEADRLGAAPPVIDSVDIRADPEGTLSRLCAAIGLVWTPSMLSWPSGGIPEDGVWAAHWYGAVHRSTGFDAAEGVLPDLSADFEGLLDKTMPFYDRLSRHRI